MQKPEEAQASSGLCIPQQSGAGTQSRNSLPLRQSAAPKCSAPPPPTPQRSGGVSRGKGESKEGLGGNRNPPLPPWPPEAATRLLPQPKAAQERAAKSAGQQKNAKHRISPLPQRQSAAPERIALPPPTPQRSGGVSRGKGESKEGLGGNRTPPGPPWPPEAATRLLTQPNAAQERRRESRKATQERRATPNPFAPAAERRARTRRERRKAPPCNNRRTRLKREKVKALSHPPGGICDKISNLSPCGAVRAENVIANGTWM